MVEQGNYPYVEGSHGIPFFSMQEVSSGFFEIAGRKLQYLVDRETLHVWNPDSKSHEGLKAWVSNGVLSLNLCTRPTYTSDKDVPRHPDMFAAKFIDVALDHFKKMGTLISAFRANWVLGDNLATYRIIIDKTGNRVIAANNTWTADAITSRGFLPAVLEDIKEERAGVTVIFNKAENT